MTAVLKTVPLGSIRPNPFRDIEHYPIDRVKVELLRQSFERTGFWEGYLMVRPTADGGYEQPWGHHRVVAAIELWGKDHAVPVIVKDLSDDMMLAMMAHENNEHYAQYFYLSVMEPIEAVVKAYAEGRVELVPDPKAPTSSQRHAPSYVVGTGQQHPYTATTVANFLGWTSKRGSSGQAADKVHLALSALELIEKKVLSRQQFLTLTQSQAEGLVSATRATIRAREADAEAEARVHTEAAVRAEKAGDTRKAEQHKAAAERARENAAEGAAKAAKSVASQVAERLASGERLKDVLEDTVASGVKDAQRAAERVQERVSPRACTAEQAEDYGRRMDKLVSEEDREWLTTCRSSKARTELLSAAKRLRERLALLIKEIG